MSLYGLRTLELKPGTLTRCCVRPVFDKTRQGKAISLLYGFQKKNIYCLEYTRFYLHQFNFKFTFSLLNMFTWYFFNGGGGGQSMVTLVVT